MHSLVLSDNCLRICFHTVWGLVLFMELSEEQQKFLDALEEEFSDRFTVHDEVYWEEHTSPTLDPPIVEPWYSKPRRRFDFARRGRDNDVNGRDRSGDRSNSNRYDRHDRYSHNRDRSFNRDSRDGRDRRDFNGGQSGYSGRDAGWDRDRDRDHRHRSDSNRYSGHPGRQQYK